MESVQSLTPRENCITSACKLSRRCRRVIGAMLCMELACRLCLVASWCIARRFLLPFFLSCFLSSWKVVVRIASGWLASCIVSLVKPASQAAAVVLASAGEMHRVVLWSGRRECVASLMIACLLSQAAAVVVEPMVMRHRIVQ